MPPSGPLQALAFRIYPAQSGIQGINKPDILQSPGVECAAHYIGAHKALEKGLYIHGLKIKKHRS
jgi:hypothetical protein